MTDALTSLKGSLYVQFHAYESPKYIGQVSTGSLTEPRGDVTVVPTRTTTGVIESAFAARSAPVGSVLTLTALTFSEQDLIDLIGDCEVSLYITQDCQLRKGILDAYDRCYIVHHVRLTKLTRDGLAERVVDSESTRGLEFTIGLPVHAVGHVDSLRRIATTSANDWLDVASWRFERCSSPRGYEQAWCQYMVAITEFAPGPAPAQVWYSQDGGETWTRTATDPYAAGEVLSACAIFPTHEGTIRIIVAKYHDPDIMYSDDWGTTWTNVAYKFDDLNFYYGPLTHNGLFYLDGHNIWIVSYDHHADVENTVHVSHTGGETWEQLGTIPNVVHSIFFVDPNNGFAGATDGRVYVTDDGGLTWTLAADTGAGYQFTSIYAFDTKHVIAGADAGFGLYETFDGWLTWNRPVVSPTLIIANEIVIDMDFFNAFCGFILSYNSVANTARLYWTMDGGRSWHYHNPAFSAMRALVACGLEDALAVGDVNAGTAAIIKTVHH